MDEEPPLPDFIDKTLEWLSERFMNRVLRRGLLPEEAYRTDSSEPNRLLKDFENEVRSRADSTECEHCKYMAESLSTPSFLTVMGWGQSWRVKLDFALLQSCSATCSLCSFILRFIEQDESFFEIVKKCATSLRIVSNFIGVLSKQNVSNGTEITKDDGFYPQLTVTFAPNADLKNIRIGTGGLVWPLHEEGILPYEDAASGSTQEQKPFTGQLIKDKIDCTLLTAWLQTCKDQHGGFCQPNTLLARPDLQLRMIDVSRQCVVPADPNAQFVALSYVWGPKAKDDRLVLTRDSSPRLFKEGGLAADRDDVSQTFRDAVVLVHRLGFKYLWIDALCIQQDDSADLEAQMSNMDQIYGCAALTIVCDTTNSDSGLPGFRWNTRKVDQQLYKGEHVSLITTKPAPWSESEASPWSTRGWTLQEDVLSKRLLVFTPRQVFYNCRLATFVEHTTHRTPSGLLPILDAMKGKQKTRGSFFWRRTRQFEHQEGLYYFAELTPFSPLTEYQALLNAYTQRHLTNAGDAIFGFSGILASLRPELGDQFWGLSTRYFTQMMHWDHGDRYTDRNEAFPSWSWAGWIDGKGQSLTFRQIQIDEPLDYLIDWYRLGDDDRGHLLIDDELRNKRGYARNCPLLNPPKKHWDWARSKDKNKGEREPMLYKAPDMTAFDFSGFVGRLSSTDNRSHPPKTHILRFWAISVILAVHRDTIYEQSTSAVVAYTLNIPGDKSKRKKSLGNINLGQLWVASQPQDMEFIVLSRNEGDVVTLMLVETMGEIAYRVRLTKVSTDNEVWKKVKPEWKLYNFA